MLERTGYLALLLVIVLTVVGCCLESVVPGTRTMSEAYADSQTTVGADFRFVQLHSDASETYLQ